MKIESVGQMVALICVALLLAGMMPVQAQAQTQTTVTVETDSVRQTLVATSKSEEGTAKVWVVKDPNSEEVKVSRVADEKWHRITQLGNKPWGRPGTLDEIRKDPKVREYIKTMTTLKPEQQEALNKGLDSGQWTTLKARDIPILESFWGYNWQQYKVSMELESKFLNTDVYAYYSEETREFFFFYSFCRNLAQPFSGWFWEAKVTENLTPKEPEVVVPQVVAPRCLKLSAVNGLETPLVGDESRTYAAEFSNPSGVDMTVSYVMFNAKGERLPLSKGNATVEMASKWVGFGKFRLAVEAEYGNKKIVDTSACELEISMLPPPPTVTVSKAPPPPKKGHPVLIGGLLGAAAVVILAVLLSRGGKGTKPTVAVIGDPSFKK